MYIAIQFIVHYSTTLLYYSLPQGYSVPNKFIATQGELLSTVVGSCMATVITCGASPLITVHHSPPLGPLPKTVVDFWRLVWQERPPTIVMVTNVKEGNRIKCQQYWPDSGKKEFGPFQVTISDQQVFADYTIRTLSVSVSHTAEFREAELFYTHCM